MGFYSSRRRRDWGDGKCRCDGPANHILVVCNSGNKPTTIIVSDLEFSSCDFISAPTQSTFAGLSIVRTDTALSL